MTRNVLLLLLALIICVSPVLAAPVSTAVPDLFIDPSAKKIIGVFLEAPVTFVNNEKVRKAVPEKAKGLFSPQLFSVLSFDTTTMALRTYKEDNRMIVNQYYSQPVNREDIQKIAKEIKADYALFIIISNDAPRFSAGLFSMTYRTTVTCDVRLLNVATGKYITSKQIVKDGSSTAIYMGVPSFDNAYNEALEKALAELTIDTSLL